MNSPSWLRSRKSLYRLAWILFWIGVLVPAPGFVFSGFWGTISGLSVVGIIIEWSTALPDPLDGRHFLAILVLVLSLCSTLVFAATRVIREAAVSWAWRILLFTSLAANVSVSFFFPNFLWLPGFWFWLLGWGALCWSLLVIPGTSPASASASAKDDPSAVPTLVWVWLGFFVFWMGVTAVNRLVPAEPAATSAAMAPETSALTSYVTDDGHILQAGEKERFDRILSAFEKETSNQIAVAVYPRVPTGSIEEFTIQTAERSRLGRKGLDNGAILFVFMAEHVARLEVGYGLEGSLPDITAAHILDQELAPRFARSEYVDGLEASLAAIMDAVRADYQKARAPSIVTVAWRQVVAAAKRIRREAWPALRQTDAGARVSISFFAGLLGVGVFSGLANTALLVHALGRGGWNLIRRRSFGAEIEHVDFSPIWDTLKLVVIIAVLVGGVVVIAGGGAFGGAGVLIRW